MIKKIPTIPMKPEDLRLLAVANGMVDRAVVSGSAENLDPEIWHDELCQNAACMAQQLYLDLKETIV